MACSGTWTRNAYWSSDPDSINSHRCFRYPDFRAVPNAQIHQRGAQGNVMVRVYSHMQFHAQDKLLIIRIN
jgi:hypothetical protein